MTVAGNYYYNTHEQIAGGQNASQNCKEGQSVCQFWGRVDKVSVLSNH